MSLKKKNILGGLDPYSAISSVVGDITREITNYLEVKEYNITERKRIQAALETATKIINDDTEKFRIYIENEYTDKNRLYKNAEKMIDKGLSENDLEMLNIGCNFMMMAFNKNPINEYKSQIDFKSVASGFFQSDFTKKIEG